VVLKTYTPGGVPKATDNVRVSIAVDELNADELTALPVKPKSPITVVWTKPVWSEFAVVSCCG
jgi:hypothetical protein